MGNTSGRYPGARREGEELGERMFGESVSLRELNRIRRYLHDPAT